MAQENESTIVIRGDATGAVAAVQQTERAIAQLQRTASGSVGDSVRAAQQGAELHRRNAQMIEDAGRRAVAARAAQVRAAAEQAVADRKAAIASVDAWAKADVTGMFRPWIEARKQWLEGAEQVGTAAMTQRAALLALGGAAAAGAAAVAAAGVAIVASSAEVIANIGSYDLSLSRHREQLLTAAQASAALHTEITDLRVEIAGRMAPAFTAMATASANAIGYLEQTADVADRSRVAATLAAQGWHDTADALTQTGGAISYVWTQSQALAGSGLDLALAPLVRVYDDLALAAGNAAQMLGYQDPAIQRQMDEIARRRAQADRLWAEASAKARTFSMEADAEAARAAQETADSFILAGAAATTRSGATSRLTTATRAQTDADREAETAVQGLVSAWGKATSALDGYMQQLDEANARAARAAQNRADTAQAGNVAAGRSAGAAPTIQDPAAVAALADNAEQASGRAARATGAQWRMAAQEVMGATSSMVGSVGSFIADSYAKQAAGANKYSQAHRNAMRKAFAAQKAAALAQAAISLALGIMQVWSSWSALPPVAAALTAVVGAVGAVQIGLIAAQKPSFHRGGLYQMAPGQAPDERAASVSMLQSERLAVIPQRGSLGAEGEVSRRSTGERSTDAPMQPVVYIMDGSGRRSTRPFAGLSPLMGRRQIA